MQPVRLVDDVVTLRDLVLVTEEVTERVLDGETDPVFVGGPDGRTVVLELGDRVKLRDLDRVTDTVADRVANEDGRTVALGLGDTDTERVRVACPDDCTVVLALRDRVKLRDLDRVTEFVAELLAAPEGRTVALELGESV